MPIWGGPGSLSTRYRLPRAPIAGGALAAASGAVTDGGSSRSAITQRRAAEARRQHRGGTGAARPPLARGDPRQARGMPGGRPPTAHTRTSSTITRVVGTLTRAPRSPDTCSIRLLQTAAVFRFPHGHPLSRHHRPRHRRRPPGLPLSAPSILRVPSIVLRLRPASLSRRPPSGEGSPSLRPETQSLHL